MKNQVIAKIKTICPLTLSIGIIYLHQEQILIKKKDWTRYILVILIYSASNINTHHERNKKALAWYNLLQTLYKTKFFHLKKYFINIKCYSVELTTEYSLTTSKYWNQLTNIRALSNRRSTKSLITELNVFSSSWKTVLERLYWMSKSTKVSTPAHCFLLRH